MANDFGQDYTRFVLLSAARTGSNMLTSALNTSPAIICFREIFHSFEERVDYHVPGYDDNSAADRELRDRDFKSFLAQRIFCQHDSAIGAVGFKAPHDHFWASQALVDWLVAERNLHVIHLTRENLLRKLVSLKVAEATQVWVEDRAQSRPPKVRAATVAKAVRNPLWAVRMIRNVVSPAEPLWKAERPQFTVGVEECREFFAKARADTEHFGGLFAEHPLMHVTYEELSGDSRRTLDAVQSFLGLKPRRLAPTTRQQNPEPLRDLIENYDELAAAFAGTPEATFFD